MHKVASVLRIVQSDVEDRRVFFDQISLMGAFQYASFGCLRSVGPGASKTFMVKSSSPALPSGWGGVVPATTPIRHSSFPRHIRRLWSHHMQNAIRRMSTPIKIGRV
jgi:hypothetical protein